LLKKGVGLADEGIPLMGFLADREEPNFGLMEACELGVVRGEEGKLEEPLGRAVEVGPSVDEEGVALAAGQLEEQRRAFEAGKTAEHQESGRQGCSGMPHGDHACNLFSPKELHGHHDRGLFPMAEGGDLLLHAENPGGRLDGEISLTAPELSSELLGLADQEERNPLSGCPQSPLHGDRGSPIAPHGVEGDRLHAEGVRCFWIRASKLRLG
jgi:hypothetical protein